MNDRIEFSNSGKEANYLTESDDTAILKCGNTTICFLASYQWLMCYPETECANKQSIQKFLDNESNILNVILISNSTECTLSISDNTFKFHTRDRAGNFLICTTLSCQYDFENNKTEITKFLNYLKNQYDTKTPC